MGVNIDIHSYDYNELVDGIQKYTRTKDIKLIKYVLEQCGSHIGDRYIILNQELWEDYSAYYNVASVIDELFNVDDSFSEIFCTFDNKFSHEQLLSESDSVDDIIYQVKEVIGL